MRPRLRLAGSILVAGLCGGAAPAAAQGLAPHDLRPDGVGPTNDARTSTAGDVVLVPDGPPISILPRYHAFERDFAAVFGAPVGGASSALEESLLLDLRRWFATRYGDSTFVRWVEGALATYDRVQEGATIERRGFDMRWNVDDMAEGKVGLEVRRSLD